MKNKYIIYTNLPVLVSKKKKERREKKWGALVIYLFKVLTNSFVFKLN